MYLTVVFVLGTFFPYYYRPSRNLLTLLHSAAYLRWWVKQSVVRIRAIEKFQKKNMFIAFVGFASMLPYLLLYRPFSLTVSTLLLILCVLLKPGTCKKNFLQTDSFGVSRACFWRVVKVISVILQHIHCQVVSTWGMLICVIKQRLGCWSEQRIGFS